MNLLKQHIEALIFCSEQSISLNEIKASLKLSYGWEPEDELVLESIEELKAKYSSEDFAFEMAEIAGGFQLLTKKDYHPTVTALIQHKAKKRLSTAQLETLSIIAYRQPVTKTEVEHIRGVNCDYAMQKLLEKELIEIHGKSDTPGKPLIYITSPSFMDYFGIQSVKDLPQLKDIHPEQNEIGEPADYVPAPQVSETVTLDAEETIVVEGLVDPFELPDRKAIFLEHNEEISSIGEQETTDDPEDNSYNLPRD